MIFVPGAGLPRAAFTNLGVSLPPHPDLSTNAPGVSTKLRDAVVIYCAGLAKKVILRHGTLVKDDLPRAAVFYPFNPPRDE